jgi:hypothetical protein
MDYYRFLCSLNVPHTVSSIWFPPYKSDQGDKPSRPGSGKSFGKNNFRLGQLPHSLIHTAGSSSCTGTYSDGSSGQNYPPQCFSAMSFATTQTTEKTENTLRPFRAGTPVVFKDGHTTLNRRKDYSEEIREYMKRPKTADEYIGRRQLGLNFKTQLIMILCDSLLQNSSQTKEWNCKWKQTWIWKRKSPAPRRPSVESQLQQLKCLLPPNQRYGEREFCNNNAPFTSPFHRCSAKWTSRMRLECITGAFFWLHDLVIILIGFWYPLQAMVRG